MVGFATLASYNLTQLAPLRKRKPRSERGRWILQHRKALWILCAVSLGIVGALATKLSLYDWLNFGHLFLLSLFYDDIIGNIPLRKIPYAKPFFITYVWTMTCAFPPIYDSGDLSLLWTLPECFLFIFGLCVLFDFRDVHEDRELGIKTFATKLSPVRIKALAFACVLASAIYFKAKTGANLTFISLYMAAFALLTLRIKSESGEHAYLLGVDGMIALKLLWLIP